MGSIRVAVAAVASLALVLGVAAAGGIDWSKAKPIEDDGVGWGVIPLDGGKVDAFFGRPESDYVVVRISCSKTRSLDFSYIDGTMKPHAKYRVHLRTGTHEFALSGRTAERWEMDDLVELRFGAPTGQLAADLRAGADLLVFIAEDGSQWTTAFALAGDAKALAPFFAACGG